MTWWTRCSMLSCSGSTNYWQRPGPRHQAPGAPQSTRVRGPTCLLCPPPSPKYPLITVQGKSLSETLLNICFHFHKQARNKHSEHIIAENHDTEYGPLFMLELLILACNAEA
jgi:hypothetical protein